MGNYAKIPNNPPLHFDWSKHQAQTVYVQRIKQTPFIDAQPYSLNPPIFIDTHEIPLEDLIAPRRSNNQFLPPAQILNIIRCVLSGLVQLQQMNYTAHGDICSNTIYYEKKTKRFKLKHPIFCQESGFDLASSGKRFSFLSPEQIVYLSEPIDEPKDETTLKVSFKSDLFVFAVLLCEVCTLSPSTQIYCPETYNIYHLEIQNRMLLIDKLYGSHPENRADYLRIRKSMEDMLEYDELVRKNPKQILNDLQPQREQGLATHAADYLGNAHGYRSQPLMGTNLFIEQ